MASIKFIVIIFYKILLLQLLIKSFDELLRRTLSKHEYRQQNFASGIYKMNFVIGCHVFIDDSIHILNVGHCPTVTAMALINDGSQVFKPADLEICGRYESSLGEDI